MPACARSRPVAHNAAASRSLRVFRNQDRHDTSVEVLRLAAAGATQRFAHPYIHLNSRSGLVGNIRFCFQALDDDNGIYIRTSQTMNQVSASAVVGTVT